MNGICEGRVAVVTGAGNGIGRAHALLFAAEGAAVVVNDLGGSRDGTGGDTGPAHAVVEEIRAIGGSAVAHTEDISTWDGSKGLIDLALSEFGRLDVVVNNAGILRDRMLTNMSEAEWDGVIRVHLKGTFGPTRHAAEHWREQAKSGKEVDGRVINTTSPSGLFGNVGQSNYGAAKAGIAAFTVIVAEELGRYGVTVNAISPTALTRMTEDLGGLAAMSEERDLSPSTISPVVVWLGSQLSRGVTGRVFSVFGNKVFVAEGWTNGPFVDREDGWTPGELGEALPEILREAAPNADMSGARRGPTT